MSIDHYTYRLTWSPEDNEHIGLCTEFPSLSWLAPSQEAWRASANGRRSRSRYVSRR